ncbi:MAG: sulfatase [Planctomycetaceae bacterium]|nr:sulfatase [Planctomycetaceae bacterium]
MPSTKRPNILFILIDDLGWRDLGCQGSSFYETPCLDRLAQQGMRFTDAYAACPVCSPTRASIMSGKYPAALGVTDWIDWGNWLHPLRGRVIDAPYVRQLPLSEHSLAAALRDGGYQTWHVGKWHLGKEPYWPQHHGFDVNVGGSDIGCPMSGYFAPWKLPNMPDAPQRTFLTDCLTDEAVKLIRNRGDKPFFLNLWHYAVHTPIQAPQRYLDKYAAKAASLGLDKKQWFELGRMHHVEGRENLPVKRRLFQSDIAYAGLVQNLDENIGRVLAALDEEGIADNTIVFFTSDNGGLATSEGSPTCNAPLAEGKGWMFEGGTRTPLLVRWPGVTAADSVCTTPVTSPDFYPTILEMAGLPALPAQHSDGVSIAPLLRGGAELPREAIFWHYPHYGNQGGTPGASVRCGDWKLIEFYEDRHVELYNLREDVSEDHDQAAVQPDIAHRLQKMLHEWLAKVDAKIPQPNPEYHGPSTP